MADPNHAKILMKIIEQGRLDAVKRYLKLNDSTSKDLTDIVDLTAKICEAPMALVTLVDDQMQWFKAKKGVELICTTRSESFCQFTIEHDNIMVIEDAQKDARVKDLAIVTGEPNIRFYAGANLTTLEGFNVGTLCVLDTVPRKLSETQLHSLKVLARQVVNIMELSRSVDILNLKHREVLKQKQATDNSQMQLRAIFDSSKDIFILLGKHVEVLSANKAAIQRTKSVTGEDMKEGKYLSDYMESVILKKFIRFYSAALAGHNVRAEFNVRRDTPFATWLDISFMTVKSGDRVLGVAINATDITARKRHEQHIDLQNKALNKIAIIQSHELRKPVASLIGVLDIIKLETTDPEINYPYFKMIEETINELDQKICGIVKESEITLNTRLYDNQ